MDQEHIVEIVSETTSELSSIRVVRGNLDRLGAKRGSFLSFQIFPLKTCAIKTPEICKN
jgi:hypothetical protein